MDVQFELVLLVLGLLFLLSMLAGKMGSKFGVPALLLFLMVGMVVGTDGVGIEFEDVEAAQTIGTLALCVILFSGGLSTKMSEIKPILAQGIVPGYNRRASHGHYNRRVDLVDLRHDC